MPEERKIEPGERPKDELTNEEREKLDKAEENVRRSINENDAKDIKAASISYNMLQVEITIDLIKRKIGDNEKSRALGKVLTDFSNKIFKDSNYYNDLGEFDINKLRRNFFTIDPKGKRIINYSKLGIDDQSILPNADAGINEYLDKLLPEMYNGISSINSNIPDTINSSFKSDELLNDNNLHDNAERVGNTANDIAETITDNDESKYRRNATQNEIERMEREGTTDKQNSSMSFKDFIRLISILARVFSTLAFLWVVISFGLGHSGCMQYKCTEGDSFLISTKAICSTKGSNAGINILDPNQGITTFTSTNCTCSKLQSGQNPINCNSSACEIDPQNNKLRPYGNQCNPGDKCQNEDGTSCPIIKYQFDVFNPLSLLQQVIAVGGNAAGKAFPKIIEIIIVIGIIIGVLLVLWIIYKVVANRKPAETLKIETVAAPGTVTKFGNRGYLGNLSKYSNYAYMGRCVAQPARPYIPPRFKF
jgi:hypothetical protein